MIGTLNATQLWMDIRLEDGKFKLVPVQNEDIGGQLLPILSKGLYTYPLHAIREYVQNAVDAGATQVTIKITGNSVVISDNGKGMNLYELIQARQFGVSMKDVRETVGFRGIGIYSGFDLCNRLLITSKREGEKYSYVLEFDFGSMKRVLDAEAKSGIRRTSLTSLLEIHSRFSQEPEDEHQHYTVVQLEDISDVHIQELENREELKQYILRNLPIDFDRHFTYRDTINAQLRAKVPGYKAITVVLESDNAPLDIVAKPSIPDLDEPIMEPIKDAKGEMIAFYWACLHKPGLDQAREKTKQGDDRENEVSPVQQIVGRGQIPEEYKDYRGFVYKVKGFTIGNNEKLRHVFKKGNSGLYLWYTGEIYVVDPQVIPNTARDDFETGPSQRVLETRIHDVLKKLEEQAAQYQEEGRALDKFVPRVDELLRLSEQIENNTYELAHTYSDLDNIVRELKSQKGRLPKDRRQWGQDIIDGFEKLRRQVQGEINNPQPARQKRRETVKDRPPQDDSAVRVSPKPTPVKTLSPVKPLAQIIEDAGWALAEDCSQLIHIIDHALADVLASGSSTHQAVLADIEAKLSIELTD